MNGHRPEVYTPRQIPGWEAFLIRILERWLRKTSSKAWDKQRRG